MAKFIVEIDTDNAAFEEDFELELAAILTVLAKKVANCRGFDFKLRDRNGNIVGSSYLEEEPSEEKSDEC